MDYDHQLTRYPKDSAKWYTQLIKNTTGNPMRKEREEREAREMKLNRGEAAGADVQVADL